jgi:hypothetical protein
LSDDRLFPSARKILHFEGVNGPDAIKRKSPAQDEPWHYFNPFDDKDTELLDTIQDHYQQLVSELATGNVERSAFEAAWLAHAVVDGLTPAHHFPYEEKLTELRGGLGKETRTTIKEKWIMHGATRKEKARNNWKMWGAKGLVLTHGMFEVGVAALLTPLSFKDIALDPKDADHFFELGVQDWFRNTAREIAVLGMYDNYYEKGWTPKLAWQVRHRLGPTMVQSVALVWYAAMKEARLVQADA